MTSDSATPFVDLMDDFAIAAMMQLIREYSPQELSNENGRMEEWCDKIARVSYRMAICMMDARAVPHAVILEDLKEQEENAA